MTVLKREEPRWLEKVAAEDTVQFLEAAITGVYKCVCMCVFYQTMINYAFQPLNSKMRYRISLNKGHLESLNQGHNEGC